MGKVQSCNDVRMYLMMIVEVSGEMSCTAEELVSFKNALCSESELFQYWREERKLQWRQLF